MDQPDILPSTAALHERVATWRRAANRIALVPTMGALHAGHLSLARIAKQAAARTIVSIFVNPTQFAPGEDFERYPRTLAADLEKLGSVGVDAVFAPPVEEVYPSGFATTISVAGPAVAGLEDRFRPTHFAGVATVVGKLLIAASPDVAIFGEKDYQQLQVIRRLVADLGLPVEIVGAPIMREPDGLAMSSRNAYLGAAERAAAPALNAVLRGCAARIGRGEAVASALEAGRGEAAAAGFALDYLELRDAETLAPVTRPEGRPCRLLVAGSLGKTRLIDNLALAAVDAETE